MVRPVLRGVAVRRFVRPPKWDSELAPSPRSPASALHYRRLCPGLWRSLRSRGLVPAQGCVAGRRSDPLRQAQPRQGYQHPVLPASSPISADTIANEGRIYTCTTSGTRTVALVRAVPVRVLQTARQRGRPCPRVFEATEPQTSSKPRTSMGPGRHRTPIRWATWWRTPSADTSAPPLEPLQLAGDRPPRAQASPMGLRCGPSRMVAWGCST